MMKYKVPAAVRLLVLGLTVSSVVLMACQKKADSSATTIPVSQPYFHKGVGAPIDSATANRWKQNWIQRQSKNRSTANTPAIFYLPATALRAIISRENTIGILFYYGQDSTSGVYLEAIGIDNRDYVMRTETVITSNGPISWKMAKQWRDYFKQQHPTGIWGYFEGTEAVERLLAQDAKLVRIEFGINDNSSQTLLLSNAADPVPLVYEDNLRPCPSYCAIDENGE